MQPQALQTVIDANPAELTDDRADFTDVLPSRVARVLADALISNALDQKTLRELWPRVMLDDRVSRGIGMLTSCSELSVEQISHECAMSPRHFRRAVQQTSGLTPKTLQRVRRLHLVLEIARRDPRTSLSMIAARAGYVDQSHLARDVRQLVDLTSQQFLQEQL